MREFKQRQTRYNKIEEIKSKEDLELNKHLITNFFDFESSFIFGENKLVSGEDYDIRDLAIRFLPNGGSTVIKDDDGRKYEISKEFDYVEEIGLKNNVILETYLLYRLSNLKEIPSKRWNEQEIKEALIKGNLETPLRISGDWRW